MHHSKWSSPSLPRTLVIVEVKQRNTRKNATPNAEFMIILIVLVAVILVVVFLVFLLLLKTTEKTTYTVTLG